MLARLRSLLLRVVFGLYRGLLSPVLHQFGRSQCIFLPTCSEYAFVAMERFGVLRGGAMALRRLSRCHPLGKGGLDPVPDR
ncbi:MAG: membrane protein insertion efficiency factor YidD [Acidobacteriota bacterium]|nr:membrane protein insertion efficiency factor YidD [Acidobacteriota bacterium]